MSLLSLLIIGKVVTDEELRLRQFRRNLEKYEQEGTDFTEDFKRNLMMNRDQDEEVEKERKKMLRRKKKMKLRDREMEKHNKNQVAMLGDDDDD